MKNVELDSLVISARPDSELIISISGGETIAISPRRIQLTSSRRTGIFNITGMVGGYYSIRYQLSGADANSFITPEDTAIVVQDTLPSRLPNQYFEELDLAVVGLLFASCCVPTESIAFNDQCQGINKVVFRSACSWTSTKENSHTTTGVVFAENQGLKLPVSIAGVEISPDVENDGSYRARLPQSALTACTPCREVRPNCCPEDKPDCNRQRTQNDMSTCYCYNFSIADTLDFLKIASLALTYITNMRVLLPSWIQDIQAFLPTSNFDEGIFSQYEYTTEIVSAEQISQLSSCEMIKPALPGLYSVMRYGRGMLAIIDRKRFVYDDRRIQPDHENPMCFAVNLCSGLESPVFIQLSPRIHNIILRSFLREYVVSRNWRITIHSVALYKERMSRNPFPIEEYWNGNSMFEVETPQFDLSMAMDSDIPFQIDDLRIDLTFSGNAYYLYLVS